jgi:hypothetical protein
LARVPIGDIYSAFRGAGFSDAQARALAAETGRETGLQSSFLYGTHSDPANKATNFGLMSFQGNRRTSVLDFLRQAGRVNEKGEVIPGPETLLAQAQFVRREMETAPEYARTREQFLANPNVDSETAAAVLGRNYIRWRFDDPRYAGHHETRRKFLASIPSADMARDEVQVGSPAAPPPAAAPAPTAPAAPRQPAYATDIGTTARRFGNFLAPSLVDAPQPLPPEEAQAQIDEQRRMQSQLSQANDAMRAFSAISSYGQQMGAQQRPSLLQPSVVRGQFRPITMGRGLL